MKKIVLLFCLIILMGCEDAKDLSKQYIFKPDLVCEGERKGRDNTISWVSRETFLIEINDYTNNQGVNTGKYEHRSYRANGEPFTPSTGKIYWTSKQTVYGTEISFDIREFDQAYLNSLYDYDLKLVGLLRIYINEGLTRLHLGRGSFDNIDITTHNTTKLMCREK